MDRAPSNAVPPGGKIPGWMETVPICVPLKYYLESHTEDDGFQLGPQSDQRTWPRRFDARRASRSRDQSQTIPAGAHSRPTWSRHGACDVAVTSLLVSSTVIDVRSTDVGLITLLHHTQGPTPSPTCHTARHLVRLPCGNLRCRGSCPPAPP